MCVGALSKRCLNSARLMLWQLSWAAVPVLSHPLGENLIPHMETKLLWHSFVLSEIDIFVKIIEKVLTIIFHLSKFNEHSKNTSETVSDAFFFLLAFQH